MMNAKRVVAEMRARWTETRSGLSGQALDVGLRAVSRVAALHPRANAKRYGVEIVRNVAYGPHGRANLLDIYRPRTATGAAAPVLYLHGGGFRILSKDTHWAMALSLAHRGHVVFAVNYRLAPQSPFPGGAEDACRAALWVAANAHLYGADPTRLLIAGESAGANLALVVAIARSWQRPEPWARAVFDANLEIAGLLPACGMLQVTEPTVRGTTPGFVLDRIQQIGADYVPAGLDARALELVDVASFLERAPPPARALPPMFAVCGGGDPVVQDTERLAPAWRALGGDGSHKLYGKAIHAFHAFVWTPLAREAWRDQHAFIDRVLAGC